MASNTFHQAEQQDKKKAKRIAFYFCLALLIGLIIPFLVTKTPPIKYEKAIEIEFTSFKSASEKSSTKKAAPAPKKTTEKPTKKVEPAKRPKVKHKTVITTPEPKAPEIKTSPKPKDTPKETPKVSEIPDDPTPKTTPAETKTSTKTETTGAPSEEGEGTKGSSKTGDADTDGKADKGDSGEDFSGDGLLTRSVVHRVDVKKLVKESGKVVINICVNKRGRVIFSEFNKEESTIKNTSIVRKVQEAVKQYRFEKDYSAPKEQCGKWTIVFDVDE